MNSSCTKNFRATSSHLLCHDETHLLEDLPVESRHNVRLYYVMKQ